MVSILSFAGDAFQIIGLSLMCSLSLAAHRRIPAGTSTPVAFRAGQVMVRAPKLPALWLFPVLVLAFGLWTKMESLAPDMNTNTAIIWFGVRATVAPLVALAHMSQVRQALAALDREGSL